MIELLESELGKSTDVVYRCFQLGNSNIPAIIIYLDTLVEVDIINSQIMESVLLFGGEILLEEKGDMFRLVVNKLFTVGQVKEIKAHK